MEAFLREPMQILRDAQAEVTGILSGYYDDLTHVFGDRREDQVTLDDIYTYTHTTACDILRYAKAHLRRYPNHAESLVLRKYSALLTRVNRRTEQALGELSVYGTTSVSKWNAITRYQNYMRKRATRLVSRCNRMSCNEPAKNIASLLSALADCLVVPIGDPRPESLRAQIREQFGEATGWVATEVVALAFDQTPRAAYDEVVANGVIPIAYPYYLTSPSLNPLHLGARVDGHGTVHRYEDRGTFMVETK